MSALAVALALDELKHSFDTEKPDPILCACEIVELPWHWVDPSTMGLAPRWVPPRHLCPDCRAIMVEAEMELGLDDRLQELGVGPEHLGYTWDRHLKQGRDEPFDAFFERCGDEPTRTLGITATNWRAAVLLRSWRPGRYQPHGSPAGSLTGPHWLFVSGPPGSGKTLLTVCLIRELLKVPLEWVERRDLQVPGYRPPLARRGGYSVGYYPEQELQRSWLAWQRQRRTVEADPLDHARQVRVLVLDDLGAGRATEAWRYAMAALIDYRYRRQLPTVITGNLAYDALGEHYKDRRMVSRLAAMVAGTEVVLDARPDWRTLRQAGD